MKLNGFINVHFAVKFHSTELQPVTSSVSSVQMPLVSRYRQFPFRSRDVAAMTSHVLTVPFRRPARAGQHRAQQRTWRRTAQLAAG